MRAASSRERPLEASLPPNWMPYDADADEVLDALGPAWAAEEARAARAEMVEFEERARAALEEERREAERRYTEQV